LAAKREYEEIGQRAKEARSSLRLTQQAFSDGAGINRGYWAEIEMGKKRPSSKILEQLKAAYKISADWLLTGEGMMFNHEQIHMKYDFKPEESVTVGTRLRIARELSKLTVKEMAEIFDCTENQYLRYESGIETPEKQIIDYFVQSHGISNEWLCYGLGAILEQDEEKRAAAIPQLSIMPMGDGSHATLVSPPAGSSLSNKEIFDIFNIMAILSESERKEVMEYARDKKSHKEIDEIKRQMEEMRLQIEKLTIERNPN